jgi:hydroxymethylglutaryl-CoA lyase
MNDIKLTECPRDAMQGLTEFIPSEEKIKYIQSLLNIGFATIDAGSFVSAKAIPQMRDTGYVLDHLVLNDQSSKLLAIIANKRGAEDAVAFDQIHYLGFPFSISEQFQQRNTNSSILESVSRVEEIQQLCIKSNKELVVYISMGFGNPYGEEWSIDVVEKWTKVLAEMGIRNLSFADTIGVSNTENIKYLFENIPNRFPDVEFSAHLHSTPTDAYSKVKAAYEAGCRKFDSAIYGFGGCPMATDTLTGNIATETILSYLKNEGIESGIDEVGFVNAMRIAQTIFHI